MRCLFKDNIPLAELVLRIITDKPDLIVTDCETQKNMKRLAGTHPLCLNAYRRKKYDMDPEAEKKGGWYSLLKKIFTVCANRFIRLKG